VDITSATYRNAESRARIRVAVRDLRGSGRLVARIAVPDSDAFFHATVVEHADGSRSKKFERVSNNVREAESCDFGARWSVDEDVVVVSVPHRCLRFGRFLPRHRFNATLHRNGDKDSSAGRDVGRGDSPGCVRKREMRRVHDGQKRGYVHQGLDTAGVFGDGGAGGYSRVYRACNGGPAWYIEYEGGTDLVVGKGRVG
jgi:hypothetical protein